MLGKSKGDSDGGCPGQQVEEEARAGRDHVPGLELLLVFTPTPSLLRILSWGFKGT